MDVDAGLSDGRFYQISLGQRTPPEGGQRGGILQGGDITKPSRPVSGVAEPRHFSFERAAAGVHDIQVGGWLLRWPVAEDHGGKLATGTHAC
jgi:hypothetical protein